MMENTTRNFYLAAAYMTFGAKYDKMSTDDINSPGRKTFHFTGDIPYEQIRTDFNKCMLMINASKYSDAIRNLKSILHGSE
jgi:DNA-directed RNA polymerase beta subunit